jgi:tetratricopeptide (TPR) repeat protein
MLGKLMIHLERFDEAESNLDKVLAVRLKHYPRDHILVGSAKQGLGNVYCRTNRLDLADTYLSEALSNLEKLGGENPDLPEYRNDLARLKVKQGKFKDAEELVLSAISQKERQGCDTHTDLIEYLEVLSELKRATGAIDEAEAAEQRLAAIRATIK